MSIFAERTEVRAVFKLRVNIKIGDKAKEK